MVEKTFRVMSNSDIYLSADIIAEALLKQITLTAKKDKIVFAVREVEKAPVTGLEE